MTSVKARRNPLLPLLSLTNVRMNVKTDLETNEVNLMAMGEMPKTIRSLMRRRTLTIACSMGEHLDMKHR